MNRTLLLIGLMLVLVVGPAQGALTNLGFEFGTAGWSFNIGDSNGTAAVVENFIDPYGLYAYNYAPTEGSRFLRLGAGDGDVPVVASQIFTATVGETYRGSAAFASGEDYLFYPLTWDDWASVKISNSHGYEAQLFYSQVPDVYPDGFTGWMLWTWSPPESGEYTIEYMVTNYADASYSSYALFDAAPSPVPLPPSMLLLAPGLVGVLALRRRHPK
jgi:hypothetical protein